EGCRRRPGTTRRPADVLTSDARTAPRVPGTIGFVTRPFPFPPRRGMRRDRPIASRSAPPYVHGAPRRTPIPHPPPPPSRRPLRRLPDRLPRFRPPDRFRRVSPRHVLAGLTALVLLAVPAAAAVRSAPAAAPEPVVPDSVAGAETVEYRVEQGGVAVSASYPA